MLHLVIVAFKRQNVLCFLWYERIALRIVLWFHVSGPFFFFVTWIISASFPPNFAPSPLLFGLGHDNMLLYDTSQT